MQIALWSLLRGPIGKLIDLNTGKAPNGKFPENTSLYPFG